MDKQSQLKNYTYRGISVNYRGGTEDEKVLNHSFDNDIFYKEIPSFNPGERPVIIDIGAHIGTFSLLSSIRYPAANIYSYEASLETFLILKKNKEVNNLEHLHIFHQAVAGKSGTIKLYHDQEAGNWGHSITKELSESFEEVESITLETIINRHQIASIDLIKFNCEGAEFDILLNTKKDLLQKIHVGVILYHEDLYQTGSAAKLSELFEGLNFRVTTIKKSETRGWLVVWNKKRYSWLYFLSKALLRRLKSWL